MQSQFKMHLYLTDIAEVFAHGQSHLYLFGRTSSHVTAAVKIMDFKRHLYVDPPTGYSPASFMTALNNQLDDCFIVHVREVQRLPAVGFTLEGPRTYWQITIANAVKKVITHLQTVPYGNKILTLYHEDWKATTQFMHATGIQLFTTIEIANHSNVSQRATICQVEIQSHVGHVKPGTDRSGSRPHIVVMSLRITPDAKQIGAQHYVLGESPSEPSLFTNPRDFFGHLRRIQADVITVLNDTVVNTVASILAKSGVKGCFSKLKQNDDTFEFNHRVFLRTPGVHVLDTVNEAKKMFLKPKLDVYTLAAMAVHPKLLKSPVHLTDDLRQQVQALTQLDMDTNYILGAIEIAIATDVDLRRVVNNGQQIRTWSKFQRTFYQNDLIANKAALSDVPLVIRRANYKSSFPDPVLNDSSSKLPVKRRVNLLGQVVEEKKATVSMKMAGGYVQPPVKGRHEYVVTYDFGSLYPSIMQAYRVCYQRLVFDRSLLSNPDCEFQYIPIDSLNCLVLVKSYKGNLVNTFLPDVIKALCEQRKAVRQVMKGVEKGSFEYSVLNSKQLACKVLQNAAYGFLGVTTNALFSCPVLMATVTALGRFMIKTARAYCEQQYGATALYGDTDSIMVKFPNVNSFDQIRALGEKVAREISALFPAPNQMEFESVLNHKLY